MSEIADKHDATSSGVDAATSSGVDAATSSDAGAATSSDAGAATSSDAGADAATGADAPAKPEKGVKIIKYAIIEINNGTISVTDNTDNLTTDKTPRECLTEGANCKFALQISKIDCNTSNGMCIEFENSKYMLNLDTKVSETDFSGKLIDEEFLSPAAAAAAAALDAASGDASGDAAAAVSGDTLAASAASGDASDAPTSIDIITKLQDMELLDFYLKSNIDKAILTKESSEEDIQKLIEEIFKKIDKDATKTEVTNEKHGNFGLPNIGKVCYISSLIHLLKDIKTYNPDESDSNQINSLTAKLFNYIERGDKGEYETNYNALVTALGKDPTKEGDPNDVLGKYTLGDTVTIEDVVPQDDKSIKDVFNEKKQALKTDYGIFTINRNVDDRPNWEKIDTTAPNNYELAGKILNPPGHFVYINYDDQNKPILYDDSRAEEFKDSSEIDGKKLFAPGIDKYDSLLTEYKEISKQIFKQVGKTVETLIEEYQAAEQKFLEENKLYKSTNYDEQRFKMQDKIVTMVLYRKKEAAPAVSGGSRKNRRQKSKKTKRNYYTYKK